MTSDAPAWQEAQDAGVSAQRRSLYLFKHQGCIAGLCYGLLEAPVFTPMSWAVEGKVVTVCLMKSVKVCFLQHL